MPYVFSPKPPFRVPPFRDARLFVGSIALFFLLLGLFCWSGVFVMHLIEKNIPPPEPVRVDYQALLEGVDAVPEISWDIDTNRSEAFARNPDPAEAMETIRRNAERLGYRATDRRDAFLRTSPKTTFTLESAEDGVVLRLEY